MHYVSFQCQTCLEKPLSFPADSRRYANRVNLLYNQPIKSTKKTRLDQMMVLIGRQC